MPGLFDCFRPTPDSYQIAFILYLHLNKSGKISLFLFCSKRKLIPLNFRKANPSFTVVIFFL